MSEKYVLRLFLEHPKSTRTFTQVERVLRSYFEGRTKPIKEVENGTIEALRMIKVRIDGKRNCILTEWKLTFDNKHAFHKYKLRYPDKGRNIQQRADDYERFQEMVERDVLCQSSDINLGNEPDIDIEKLMSGL